MREKNLFAILKVATDASGEDIVRAGKRLTPCARSEEERQNIRFAMTELMNDPMKRLSHEFFEFPGTRYHDEPWEKFIRKLRRTLPPSSAPEPMNADTPIFFICDLIQSAGAHYPGDISKIIRQLLANPALKLVPMEVNDDLSG